MSSVLRSGIWTPDGVQVNKSATQSFINTTDVPITFDGTYDFRLNEAYHSNVTNNSRFFALVSGYYSAGFAAGFSTQVNQLFRLRMRINGNTSDDWPGQVYPGNTSRFNFNTAYYLFMNAGDYLEFYGSVGAAATYVMNRGKARFEYMGNW